MKTCKAQIFSGTHATKILFVLGEPSKGLRIGFLWLMISITVFSP